MKYIESGNQENPSVPLVSVLAVLHIDRTASKVQAQWVFKNIQGEVNYGIDTKK